MNREDRAMEIMGICEKLRKDPDKSKILSIHAMLGYDDGQDYTGRDYQRAITFLEEGLASVGDTSDGFLAKAILWCKTRFEKGQNPGAVDLGG